MTNTIPFVATDYLKKNQKSLEPVFNTRTLKLDDDTKMKKAVVKVLERAEQLKKTFKEGRRNEYIFYVATQLKKLGIPRKFAIATLDELIGISNHVKHIERLCRVYNDDSCVFGEYKKELKSEEVRKSYKDKDSDYNTPLFDDAILEKLPKFLRKVTQIPDGERQSNILFLSTLAMIGSILEGVTCIHDDKQFYTNLNLIVQAGFASGKGSAMDIVKIGESINQYFEEKNLRLIHQYNTDHARAVKSKHPKPDYPVLYKLIFPADTSSSGLKKQLHRYGGKGVMFDTELDTLNSVSGHKWGEELSNLLRKTFMNEAIKHVRANDEVDIKSPRLSVVLTGTPQSVKRLSLILRMVCLAETYFMLSIVMQNSLRTPFLQKNGDTIRMSLTP